MLPKSWWSIKNLVLEFKYLLHQRHQKLEVWRGELFAFRYYICYGTMAQDHMIIQVFTGGAISGATYFDMVAFFDQIHIVFVLRGFVSQKENNAKDGALSEYLYEIIWPCHGFKMRW